MVTTMVIDTEWAESLKGLSMKVRDNWWPGYNGQILHDGKIDSFDSTTQKWNLLLDSNDDDALYLMAYDAVCEYSNKESSTFLEFQLHHQPFMKVMMNLKEQMEQDIRQQQQQNGAKSTCMKMADVDVQLIRLNGPVVPMVPKISLLTGFKL